MVRGDWRMVGVVGFLFVFLGVVLAVPAVPHAVRAHGTAGVAVLRALGLAFVLEPALPAGLEARLLDRWLGTAEDPGNVCAKGWR